jgi:hypothetical protein
MNRGVALAELGRLAEAVGPFDDAITLLRALVEQEGRRELANDLAAALMNRGLALAKRERPAALAAASEARDIWQILVSEGAEHLRARLDGAVGLVRILTEPN